MKNFWKVFPVLISLTIILFAGIHLTAENKAPSVDDCLACHDDKDISKVKNGKNNFTRSQKSYFATFSAW